MLVVPAAEDPRRLFVRCEGVVRFYGDLVEDLHQRGLDKDVSVVVWGEFGRTPVSESGNGRDLPPGGGPMTQQVAKAYKDYVAANAVRGGYDRAIFYDSAGDDVFSSRPDRAVLQGTGYLNVASGFDYAAANAVMGGNDWAVFYDSAGDDVFSSRSDRAVLQGAGS